MASPDSDVDPLQHGDPYDAAKYHVFARPVDWAPPRPPVLQRIPVQGDWVLIDQGTRVDGADLGDCEGRVREVEGDTALVALGTLPGHVARVVTLPLSAIKVRLFDVFKEGVSVLVTQGPYQLKEGLIKRVQQGQATILDAQGLLFTTSLSHLKPIDPQGASHG